MKKRVFFSVLILLVSCSFMVSAKSAADVSATVKDSQTKQPIEFATVELLSTKDSLLLGCITDSKGYFEITPPLKTAKIRIRFMGYKDYEVTFKNRNMGTILMMEDAKQLNEVAVKGNARQNKIDRDVFTITKEMRAGTTTSSELLGKLNGVNYNRYDKSISVDGKTNVLILIDGVEKDQNMAKNLSPDRIERIEVIKDPVGKYATDGYSAVINIVLKKDYSGVDFFIDNTSFFDVVHTNGKYPFAQDYGNLNFTYTYKNFDVYLSGWGYGGNMAIPITYTKQYGMVTSTTPPFDYSDPNSSIRNRNSSISLGGDYTLAKGHTLSAEVNYYGQHQNNNFWYDLTNSVNGVTTGQSSSTTTSQNNTDQWQGTLTYNGKFNDKSSVESDLRYSHNANVGDNSFAQDQFFSSSHINKNTNYVRFNGTYSYQFTPTFSTDLGYGYVGNNSVSSQSDSTFTYKEMRNRFSLYLNYQPAKQWRLKAGGILELYSQRYQASRNNQGAFLPYLNVQFIPSQKFNIIAKYHATVNYPGIDQLSPFKTAQDSLMWSLGNPLLKTSIYHTAGLEFHIMNAITIEPYYNFDNHHIATYITKEGNYYYSSNVNAGYYDRYGVQLNFTIPLAKTIFWQNWMDIYSNHIRYNGEGTTQHNFNINSTLVYVNPKLGVNTGLVLQKQMYRDAAIQGYTSDNNDLVVFFLQKSLMKSKLNITLLYMPPIKMGLKYEQHNLTQAGQYYQVSSTSLNLIKNLMFFEVSYHFNAGKQVTQKHTPSGQDEAKPKSGFGL
ncbi:TonB-dependent receptor [Microbacter margulisiae]|uniref:Outer membrane receptor proteins, mostly Fe transport n=1 Tax=Microbacter margulisiae TaxID=1350067 RepID=A0A7W5DQ21_9PORP|nr:outer membrane beta-barrel protein [Microbacter margulisiae]MBB3186653.1 hypothetical protein [Microbacter margulisiae]